VFLYLSVCSIFGFIRFLSLSLPFLPCLCACTVYTSGSAYLNLSPDSCYRLLTYPCSLVTPHPAFPHTESPTHAFFFVYVAYLVWRKPCATYAIYAFAFNVSHKKSFVCPLLRLLINCSHSRPNQGNTICPGTHVHGCTWLRRPHIRSGGNPREGGNELDGDHGDDGVSVMEYRDAGEKGGNLPRCLFLFKLPISVSFIRCV